MAKLQLHKFVFTKAMLEKVPEAERAVLVYAGHISNELNWFNRVTLILIQTGKEFAVKLPEPLSPQEQVCMDGNATQEMVHLRLFAGKVQESIKFLKHWCFGKPWFEAICMAMGQEGQLALTAIKSHIEQVENGTKPNIVKIVRNKFAFHYDEEAVKKSIDAASKLDEFITYLAPNVGNALYLGSESAVMEHLFIIAKCGSPRETLGKLFDDVLDLARSINQLLGHTLQVLCSKYLGDDFESLGHEKVVELDISDIEVLRLPFFTTPPQKEVTK